ncbi:MAG: hypothetical protein JXR85_01085 [Deltaproteobacteria bacterium]|nr:hypothetical protein [Deltaproteobacteria bacterium]
MKKITLKFIPISSVAYLGAGVVIILAFILIIIYPAYKQLNLLDGEIAKRQGEIGSQKILLPLYLDLVKESEKKVPDVLEIPERKILPKDNIDLIPSIFKGIARKSGMELVTVTPDFTTLARGGDAVLITIVARGGFSPLRSFLIEVGNIPYVRNIEAFEVMQRANDKELKMKLWLRAGSSEVRG